MKWKWIPVMRSANSIEPPMRIFLLVLATALWGCSDRDTRGVPVSAEAKQMGGATSERAAEIRSLIDQLVFVEGDATNEPVLSPGLADGSADYRKRFEACRTAFEKLSEAKGLAIPVLVEHLDDQRHSINFRNHYADNSVGSACYWNVYFQLVDRPDDYSEYGYSRKGRDGKGHPKPYWDGSPFDESGGLKQWLEANSKLNYLELQIKCLEWLLEREKRIGAPDADSYFLNILPLEIRILQRRGENGENVIEELNRLVTIRDGKLADQIPRELLPER